MANYLDLVKQYGLDPNNWKTAGAQYLTDPGPYGDYGNRSGTPNFTGETWSGIQGALSSAYGYNPETSEAIMNILLPVTSPAGDSVTRDRYRQSVLGSNFNNTGVGFGSTYDVDKYFGGLSGLANYLLTGGSVKQGAAEAADYNAGRAYQVMMKSDGTTAYKEGQMSPTDAAESIYRTGVAPTQSQIASLTGQPQGTGITPQSLASYAGAPPTPQQSLVDIYTNRPDLQAEANRLFPGQNPTVGGNAANTWLNDWWNQHGTQEYPGTTLGQPGGGTAGGGTGSAGGGITGGGSTGGGTTGGNTYLDFANTIMESWKQKQTGIQGIETQINSVEELLNNLDKDLDTRISENSETGGVITSAHKNRYMAVEGTPLREQLAQLSKAQSGLESGASSDLQYYNMAMDAANYQSPQDKYAQTIKEYEDKLKLEQQYATPKETENWSEPYLLGGDYVQKNTKTGEIRTAVNVASEDSDNEDTKATYDAAVKYFQNQKMFSSAINKDLSISQSYYRKLTDTGIEPTVIDWLWQAVIDGNSFEAIRQEIRNNGGDPSILDTFVQTLQPKP